MSVFNLFLFQFFFFSPCILGMLWEVTDGDIDKMTAEFISNWISSTAKRSWADVNQALWHQGIIGKFIYIYI
jgi:hypothetical protein